MLDVIGRDRLDLGRERRTAAVAELIGVDLRSQSMPRAGLEHAPPLVDREGAVVDEHVTEHGEAVARHTWNQPLADRVNPLRAIVPELGRDDVRGEQRRHESQRL